MVAEELHAAGVLALWRGLSLTLLRNVPFSAIYWVCVERAKAAFSERHAGEPTPRVKPRTAESAEQRNTRRRGNSRPNRTRGHEVWVGTVKPLWVGPTRNTPQAGGAVG